MSFVPRFIGKTVLGAAPTLGGAVGGAIAGKKGASIGKALGGGVKLLGHAFGFEQGGRVRRPPTAFKYGGAVLSHRQPRRRNRVR